MIQALNTAIVGLRAGIDQFNRSAARVSRMNAQNTDVNLAEEMVGQMLSKTAVEANLATIKTADEMQEHLLDTFA